MQSHSDCIVDYPIAATEGLVRRPGTLFKSWLSFSRCWPGKQPTSPQNQMPETCACGLLAACLCHARAISYRLERFTCHAMRRTSGMGSPARCPRIDAAHRPFFPPSSSPGHGLYCQRRSPVISRPWNMCGPDRSDSQPSFSRQRVISPSVWL